MEILDLVARFGEQHGLKADRESVARIARLPDVWQQDARPIERAPAAALTRQPWTMV